MNRLLQVCTLLACGLLAAAVYKVDQDKRVLQTRVDLLEHSLAAQDSRWDEEFEAGKLSLPDDANQWHTILIVNKAWKTNGDQRSAVTMFDTQPTLAALKRQTHWHLICAEDPEFKKFAACVDAVPCLIVERPNGQVIYRESGRQLGAHHRGLVHAMRREVQRHCPDGKCLPLHPVPVQPGPAVPDVPPSAVVTPPAESPRPDNTVAGLALAALGTAAGFAFKFRRAAGV